MNLIPKMKVNILYCKHVLRKKTDSEKREHLLEEKTQAGMGGTKE